MHINAKMRIESTIIFWRLSMQTYDIYNDIAMRTNGEIYVGVVGPVRTGKSTFIKRFMEEVVLDKVGEGYSRDRARDELPQSADGKTIMTTEPKFVPSEAALISAGDSTARIRMIDCVGYLVDGAIGGEEDGKPRMIKTPWQDESIPFERAAEDGTERVIRDHSTVGVVVTTDGSVCDIARSNYVVAEERVISELKSMGKPFTVVLNCVNPESKDTLNLATTLSEKYGVSVTPLNILNATKEKLEQVIENVLLEFPLKRIEVKVPKWMRALGKDSPIMTWLYTKLKEGSGKLKIKEFQGVASDCIQSDYFEGEPDVEVNSGEGVLNLTFKPNSDLFYKTLSQECGYDIEDDYAVMSYLIKASNAYKHYEKLKVAIDQVQNTGYGVVLPSMDEMELQEPELLKKGTQFGVKLKAKAPSIHMIRVDVETEVKPIIGSEQQSEDMVNYLMSEFRDDKQGIWNTNMFGKPLSSLVKEDLDAKIDNMPIDCRRKLHRTLNRIVNEGKGGVICILL